MNQLLQYQIEGINYCKDKDAILADDMGLGKTVQAIGVINAIRPNRTLIICPSSVVYNWKNELYKWIDDEFPMPIGIVHTRMPSTGIVICSYGMLKEIDLSTNWDLLILDEAHFIKDINSQRSNLVQVIANKCRQKLLLTGTPIPNGRPIELFPLLSIVKPEIKPKYKQFLQRYCAPRTVQFWVTIKGKKHKRKRTDYRGASNIEELNDRLVKTCMLRRKKEDVLKELPPKRRQLVEIDEKAESDIVRNISNDYDTAVKQLTYKHVGFEECSEIRKLDALQKLPAALQFIIDNLENNNKKLVIFAHHREVIGELERGLQSYNPSIIFGETPSNVRQIRVNRFQNDKTQRVIICSLKAAGIGITLTAASWVVFVELDWVPATMMQAEDRCCRIGQLDSVLIQHLVVRGTIDGKMARMLIKKQEMIERMIA